MPLSLTTCLIRDKKVLFNKAKLGEITLKSATLWSKNLHKNPFSFSEYGKKHFEKKLSGAYQADKNVGKAGLEVNILAGQHQNTHNIT
jgi:hypothetical protein